MQTYQGAAQLDALGDASRRAIVALLSAQGPLAVSRLAEQLPISRPAVSQHLKVLKAARLVQDHADGSKRIYALESRGLADLRSYFSAIWRQDLDNYADFVRAAVEERE